MNGPRSDERGTGFHLRAAIAVFLLAWVARALYLVAATRAGAFGGLFLDARLYAESAAAIRDGRAPGLGSAPYVLSPLYPLFLALFPSMAEPAATNPALDVRLVQAALGAITCALAALIAGRIAGRRAGWIAGVSAALYAPAILFDGAPLVACLSALTLTGALALLQAGEAARRRTLWTLAAGLCLGAAAALRPSALLVAVALAGALLTLPVPQPGSRARLSQAGLLFAGAALAIAPFSLQNQRAGEPLLLTAGAGFNFWVGNHAGADGTFRAPSGYDALWDPVGKGLAERAAGHPLSHAEASRAFMDEAQGDIARAPGRWLALLGHKLWLFAHPMEIPQLGASFEWHRERAWILRLPLDARWILLLACLAPFARRALREPDAAPAGEPAALRLPMALLGSYALSVVLFFVTARYRAPIMPVAIVLASVTVDAALRLLTPARRGSARARRFLALLLAVLALGALGFRSRPDIPTGAVEERQRGLALLERGDHAEAAEVLSQALEQDASPKTRVALALALRGLGRDADARRELETALEMRAGDPDTTFQLGVLMWETERNAGAARALFQRSLAARPGFADAYFNLGAIELATRDMAAAEQAFVRALEHAPAGTDWLPEAQRGLELARREQGRE